MCAMQRDPVKLRSQERTMEAFYLPMRNPRVEHRNPSLLEYFQWNNLERAPVSAAAKRYVKNRQKLGIPPHAWRDQFSLPLLQVAVQSNYVALAQWLIAQGCNVHANPNFHKEWLIDAADRNGYAKMAALLRQQAEFAMGSSEDDDPPDPDEAAR